MKNKVWAIADLHLCFGAPEKSMEVFGPEWQNYTDRLKLEWEKRVAPEDLVLLAGDISWALRLEQAQIDLRWIDALPGTKVMIRGNHDYWWSSISKVRGALPPSIHAIQNDVFNWEGLSIGGTRLWDSDEFHFDSYIDFKPRAISEKQRPCGSKIFKRELERLELSLKQLDQKAEHRLVMTHYPPIGADLASSTVSKLLENYHVDVCVFGHLHSLKGGQKMFGEKKGVRYVLTAADYLEFKPLMICK